MSKSKIILKETRKNANIPILEQVHLLLKREQVLDKAVKKILND